MAAPRHGKVGQGQAHALLHLKVAHKQFCIASAIYGGTWAWCEWGIALMILCMFGRGLFERGLTFAIPSPRAGQKMFRLLRLGFHNPYKSGSKANTDFER